MTTDTAARVTRMVIEEQRDCLHKSSFRKLPETNNRFTAIIEPLDKIAYVDYPELKLNKNESTQMPFRYVKGKDGEPYMPQVSLPPLLRPEKPIMTLSANS